MGMFLSQYSMLKSIGYGDDNYKKEETEKVLKCFKLFVLVLHDPKKHSLFHQKFSNLFERLDYLTGRNLLFMGIAKPSINWGEREWKRDYFEIWERDQLLHSFNEIKGVDNSITCFSIATSLGIKYDDLPALIISTNLSSTHFAVLKTGSEFIEKQLTELGYYTSTLQDDNANIDSEQFKLLIGNIDFYKETEYVSITEPIASLLADTFSFTNDPFNIKEDGNSHSKYVIEKLNNKLLQKINKDEVEKIKLTILLNVANQILCDHNYLHTTQKFGASDTPSFGASDSDISLSVESEKKDLVSDTLKNILYNDSLEQESKIVAQTTNAVYNFYKESSSSPEFDFSPLVLGLSKIFEIETNLSVVHWIRKYLNIEMPDYFNKYKPYFDNGKISPNESLVTAPKSIDFNMHKGIKWVPPGIGQSELIIKSLFLKKMFIETFSENEEASLLNSWMPIREFRNRASHIDIMNINDLKSIASYMGALNDSGIIIKILNLKQRYQGVQ